MPFDEVKKLPKPDRDRFAEIVYRFFIGSFHRTGHFSADPHPGNYLLMGDGRVAFIDFGMNKKLPRARIDAERRWLRAAMERDTESLRSQLGALGFFDADDVFAQRMAGLTFAVLGQLEATNNWYRIAREYLYGDPPATPLGEAEAPFWGLPTAA